MIIIVILEPKNFTTFSVEQLIGSLLEHETRLNLVEYSIEYYFKE